jgi:penicillin-binding protein 2
MRVALLKDPEVRARIERPMPIPEEPVETTPDGSVEGAAPEDPTVGAPPPAPADPPTSTVPASPAPGAPR